jgi:hypothetical protein
VADAAITKVLAAVKTLVETPSLTFHINRTDDDPLDESERPGVIVRVPHMAFEDYGFARTGSCARHCPVRFLQLRFGRRND